MHFGAGDLLQQAREVAVATRPPGSPADDHYWCARHAREYSRLQVMLAWRPSISMRAPSSVPLIADSRFCFSEKPRVSAAKMGARPSGSTTTSSVTNALNANSIGGDFTSQRRTFVGDNAPLTPQRPRPVHRRLGYPAFTRLVAFAHLLGERLYHARYI